MGNSSAIEWTEATWNPVTGCTKVSTGCKHCYAERMAWRLQKMGQPRYANGFELTLQEDVLEIPFTWKKPRLVFVNSMSDLFHEEVPISFIQEAFGVMHRASWHTFQILTKRSERLLDVARTLDWPSNVWMGVSVERSDYTYRIEHLCQVGSAIRFLSLEPLLGPLPSLGLRGIDWVIVGGESGPGARPMEREWVIDIKNQCKSHDVPFFSSNGAGPTRNVMAANSKDALGTIFQIVPGYRVEVAALFIIDAFAKRGVRFGLVSCANSWCTRKPSLPPDRPA